MYISDYGPLAVFAANIVNANKQTILKTIQSLH